MKRIISLVLVLALCLSLCACGKSKAVKNVEAMIDAIGEVTVDSEAAVVEAENAFDALTDEEKDKVENYAVLIEARTMLDAALYEKYVAELYAAIACEWINVNDMDSYVFQQDGTGTHGDKAVEFTIDPENLLLTVTEGVSSITTREFTIDLENKTPRLVPKDAATYYVETKNYDAIAQQIRAENTDILTSYEYWSNTQGLNYIMFSENGGGWCLLSGLTLGMQWEWQDNNTIRISFDYYGTTYASVVTIINTTEGPRLVNDQFVVQFAPKNKLK